MNDTIKNSDGGVESRNARSVSSADGSQSSDSTLGLTDLAGVAPSPSGSSMREAAIEECARIAEFFNDGAHIAHDMQTGIFPKRSATNDAIAAKIRGIASRHPRSDPMIPLEIAAIATLIWPNWAELPVYDQKEVLDAARRIYLAGYRRTRAADPSKQEADYD